MSKDEKCASCGGYKFSMQDGFKYCDRCGALLENFEELQDDEVGGAQLIVGSGKIKMKATNDDGNNKKKEISAPNKKTPAPRLMAEALEKRCDFIKKQRIRREELPIPHEATPDYLFRLALRIFSFTQTLSKISYILINELNFEPNIAEKILAVFQRYLIHCKVAFCDSEKCGSDEQLRFVALMENVQYEEQEREEKRRKKLARRGKGVKALNQSEAAWTLLTQGNITENLDLGSDYDEEDDVDENILEKTVNKSMEKLEISGQNDSQNSEYNDETVAVNDTTQGFIRKVTTALSKDALHRGSLFILNVEMLVAVLHSALMCAGYRNVFVSDIVRWIREDRFRISQRSIRLFRQCRSEPHRQGDPDGISGNCFAENHLQLPLYEITRTCTLFHQSLDLEKNMVPQDFETLAARFTENLNLPVDFLCRVLLLESMIPCDMSPFLRKQADIKLGYNLSQLSVISTGNLFEAFLASFGRKEHLGVLTDESDHVLLSIDTKMAAYILLVFRLTFDLDNAPCPPPPAEDEQRFDIDTWIHQLEMRIKCWQGHDMSMVLKSSCPIPEMRKKMPFGDHYLFNETRGGPALQSRRRQMGFQSCIPCEMSLNSTSTLPTVFDIRSNRFPNDRRSMEAIMSPLKFQRIVLRKEIDTDSTSKFENVDPESEKTFFRQFTNFKTTESSDKFDDFFPCAQEYTINKRPDWIQNCMARKLPTDPQTGPYHFYLSKQSCEDLYSVALPSFSRRFHFLLESLSLIIGEDQKALYAAFVMLELNLTSPELLQTIREDLLTSNPILVKCQKYSTTTDHQPCNYNIMVDHPVDRIEDLSLFRVFPESDDEDEKELETDQNVHLIDTRNHHIRDKMADIGPKRGQKRHKKIAYNFETFFGILAVKFFS